MNKDEQLVVQVLNAYKNGKIDFSNVPELETLVRQEVNKDFRDYQEKNRSCCESKNGVCHSRTTPSFRGRKLKIGHTERHSS